MAGVRKHIVEWQWVAAFCLLGPPIGGFWAVLTIVLAPFVYGALPLAFAAGVLYSMSLVQLEKKTSLGLHFKIPLAAICGFIPPALYLSQMRERGLSGALGTFGVLGAVGTVVLVELTPAIQKFFSISKQSVAVTTDTPPKKWQQVLSIVVPEIGALFAVYMMCRGSKQGRALMFLSISSWLTIRALGMATKVMTN